MSLRGPRRFGGGRSNPVKNGIATLGRQDGLVRDDNIINL